MNKIMLWTVNLCRICAKESDYLISIFDKSTNLDLENKIRHCLSCNISKEDVKPKQICQICCMKLNDLYQFITLFHKSNDGFETLLLNSIETTNQLVSKQEYGIVNESFRSTNNDNTVSMKGSSMPLAIEYRNNIIDIDGLDVAASNFTEKGVVSEISINNNVKSEIQNIIQEHSNEHYLNVTCEEKQAQAYTKEKLKNMNSKEKFNKTVSSLIKSSSYSEEYYNHNVMNSKLEKSCDDLSQPKDPLHFSNAQKISPLNHFQGTILIEDPTLDGQCLIPNKTYNYAENNDIQRINYNAIDHHSDNSQSIIKTKNHQINNSEELTTNNTPEYNKSNELNSCTSVQNTNHNRYKMISVKAICKAFEKQQNSNVDHLKPKVSKTRKTCDSLNKIKTFACNMCEKSFSRQQCLNIHIKKHDNLHLYMCNVCDKTFALQWYLTSHKRIHTDLFSCEHCGKCFNAPSKLQRHTRTHTGERPFKCPVENCGKSFSDKCNLAGHQITHTNVRNFCCDICKRSYKTKSQLREHLQAHSESPIFKCKICDKSYKWKANLILHRKKHKE